MAQGKEWIFMGSWERELFKVLGVPVDGRNVEIDVTSEENEGGFRTVSFTAGGHSLQAYLDTRYELGGPYQFTKESKGKLHVSGD